MNKEKSPIEELWNEFTQEAMYVDITGKGRIELKTICIDFAEYCKGRWYVK